MNLKSAIVVSFMCVGAMSAANAAEFEDFARVVRVQPQVEQFNQPQQDCRTEYVPVQRQQQRSIGGSIVGGLAGGLLGNQVGGGTGRAAATAAGAITGAIVGDRMDNNYNQPQYGEQAIRQCRDVDNWQARTTGYVVTYEYRGRNYTSVMPYDPGERVKLHVALTPR